MSFIATALARYMAKQSGDLFDSSKLANLLEEPVNTVVEKHLLNDADSQEYLVRMGKAMIDNEGNKFESDRFIDPDDAIFLDFENTLFNASDSPLAAAYHNLNYYKLADDKAKDVELADSDNIFVEYYKGRAGRGPGSQLITEEAKQGVAEQTVKSLKANKKYSSLFEEAPPKKLGLEQEIAAIENRDVALEKFLSGSKETNPIFRAVGSGTDFEFDTRFFNPNEIGVHAGTEGQANFLAVAKLFGEGAKADIVSNIAETGIKRTAGDTKDRVVNKVVDKEDVLKIYNLFDEYTTKLKSGMDEDSIWNSMPETTPEQRNAILAAASQLKTSPVVVQKGYINVKNPLDLGANDGPWVGSELLDAQPLNIVDSRSMGVKLAQAISDQTGFDIEDILQTPDFLELEDAAEAIRKAKFAKFDFLAESMLNAEEAMLNKKISKWIESYGFDSIKYINNYEPSYRGEEAYSYILFRPEQYKSVFARRFDPEDPRFGAAEGGIMRRLNFAEGSIVARALGISDEDVAWAKGIGKKYGEAEELDGKGDAARHLALGWLAKQSKYPSAAKFAANAREIVELDFKGRKMDWANNEKGFNLEAKNKQEAEKAISKMIDAGEAVFMTPSESRKMRGYARGGKVNKKEMACNSPKRTPQHPKKSHVVKACENGKEKIIRFGEQGAETAGKPKAGESERMKKKRKSFKARHAKNIKKGKMSAAYWADREKW